MNQLNFCFFNKTLFLWFFYWKTFSISFLSRNLICGQSAINKNKTLKNEIYKYKTGIIKNKGIPSASFFLWAAKLHIKNILLKAQHLCWRFSNKDFANLTIFFIDIAVTKFCWINQICVLSTLFFSVYECKFITFRILRSLGGNFSLNIRQNNKITHYN